MTIEILFPEICDLYGDRGNVLFLEKNFPHAHFVKTTILEEPYFVTHDVQFLYLGPMSEYNLEKVLKKLKIYQKRLNEMIQNDTIFLATGNAMAIFGTTIVKENKEILSGLNLLQIHSEIHLSKRYHSLFLGKFSEENHLIVGYKSQNTFIETKETPLFETIKEKSNTKVEGVRKRNFFGTTLLGPILISNPYFAKYLFSIMGYNQELIFEKQLVNAYNERVLEYQNQDTAYE